MQAVRFIINTNVLVIPSTDSKDFRITIHEFKSVYM